MGTRSAVDAATEIQTLFKELTAYDRNDSTNDERRVAHG